LALERLERDGQVLRNEGRWAIGTTSLPHNEWASCTCRQ
jgi:hypothetical protein